MAASISLVLQPIVLSQQSKFSIWFLCLFEVLAAMSNLERIAMDNGKMVYEHGVLHVIAVNQNGYVLFPIRSRHYDYEMASQWTQETIASHE